MVQWVDILNHKYFSRLDNSSISSGNCMDYQRFAESYSGRCNHETVLNQFNQYMYLLTFYTVQQGWITVPIQIVTRSIQESTCSTYILCEYVDASFRNYFFIMTSVSINLKVRFHLNQIIFFPWAGSGKTKYKV